MRLRIRYRNWYHGSFRTERAVFTTSGDTSCARSTTAYPYAYDDVCIYRTWQQDPKATNCTKYFINRSHFSARTANDYNTGALYTTPLGLYVTKLINTHNYNIKFIAKPKQSPHSTSKVQSDYIFKYNTSIKKFSVLYRKASLVFYLTSFHINYVVRGWKWTRQCTT